MAVVEVVEAEVAAGAAARRVVVAAGREVAVARHRLASPVGEEEDPAVATLRAVEVEDLAAAMWPAAEGRGPAAGERPAERLPSVNQAVAEEAAAAWHKAVRATVRLPSASPVPVEDPSQAAERMPATWALVAVRRSAVARKLAAAVGSAADRILGAAVALAAVVRSPPTDHRSATGRTSVVAEAVRDKAPPPCPQIDLTSAEAAPVTDLPPATGPALAVARTLGIGARALRPTGLVLAIGPALVTALVLGSPELAAARACRTWVHSARGPQEPQSAAASPVVLGNGRAHSPVWATTGRALVSRWKTVVAPSAIA